MSHYQNCAGITRRDCLQLGLTAFVGTGLSSLLRLQAQAAPASPRAAAPSVPFGRSDEDALAATAPRAEPARPAPAVAAQQKSATPVKDLRNRGMSRMRI